MVSKALKFLNHWKAVSLFAENSDLPAGKEELYNNLAVNVVVGSDLNPPLVTRFLTISCFCFCNFVPND